MTAVREMEDAAAEDANRASYASAGMAISLGG